ncbi:MAG: type II toxin-antitoxin system RelE/ParE family toxin [Prolixibacteraceae bacterium]|nr:type II toxin-antitoxin system RelE/ParE family toxin [Prolixibacteraceae bacterium]
MKKFLVKAQQKALLPMFTVKCGVWILTIFLHAACRHLSTKDKRYRNIILGSYLIIYRIHDTSIDVLRILHSHSSIKKIKTSRQIRL